MTRYRKLHGRLVAGVPVVLNFVDSRNTWTTCCRDTADRWSHRMIVRQSVGWKATLTKATSR